MLETYQKPALTFKEQLQLLQGRGLVINDHEYALAQLSTISYYRLSAYWYPFRVRDKQGEFTDDFVDGTSFDNVMELYEFDRQLRLLVIDAIERIEVYIRTLITYQLGHTYGAFGYVNSENFHPKFNHSNWIMKLKDEVSRSSDAFVSHYKGKYSGFPTLPIWMITEVMSLGSLSFCYTGLKNEDKKIISGKLNLHHKRLANWLHILTYIRNVCAHHSRLWNKELSIRPENSKMPEWAPPITPRNDRVFYILLMLRYVLKITNNGGGWFQQCNTLIESFTEKNKFHIAMGIPNTWQEHPIWK